NVEPMKVRIVEEVALNAPNFVIHLLPLFARNHMDFDVAGVQGSFARVGLFSRSDDPMISLAIENLLTIRRDVERINMVNQLLSLPRLQLEFLHDRGI